MTFRTRLLATLRAVRAVLDQPGVLVAGSEVPNLLEPGAASTLVVSQDVDLAVPVHAHAAVKGRLRGVRGLRPSEDEPSVWVPTEPDLIEVNFIGFDPAAADVDHTYVLEDAELPMMVFGPLALLEPGPPIAVEDLVIPVPLPAGLILEKLLTDRRGEKGDRDLLVVAGMLALADTDQIARMVSRYRDLHPEAREQVRSNLTTLSLLEARADMPDPVRVRGAIRRLLQRLEATGE